MVYGGNGHTSGGGTVAFPYQYCGLPSDGGQWSECSESNPSGDRRFVIYFGAFLCFSFYIFLLIYFLFNMSAKVVLQSIGSLAMHV